MRPCAGGCGCCSEGRRRRKPDLFQRDQAGARDSAPAAVPQFRNPVPMASPRGLANHRGGSRNAADLRPPQKPKPLPLLRLPVLDTCCSKSHTSYDKAPPAIWGMSLSTGGRGLRRKKGSQQGSDDRRVVGVLEDHHVPPIQARAGREASCPKRRAALAVSSG